MTSVIQSPYSEEQITAWLRGLFTVAWADGHYDPEEQEVLTQLAQDQLSTDLPSLDEPISPEELAAVLGKNAITAENFLRTAVMVALADGVYSTTEADVLHQFCDALGLKVDALEALRLTLYNSQATKSTDSAHHLLQ